MADNQDYKIFSNLIDSKDESLFLEILQDAINTNDINLAKQAIIQGAKPELLFLSSIRNLENTEILELLLENGLNLHLDKNRIITEWMGSSPIGGWRNSRPAKHQLLYFISKYFMEKPKKMAKFSTLPDKTLLFRIGLDIHNFHIMKFALDIGAHQNEALNSVLYRFYSNNNPDKNKNIEYKIIEYILNSNIKFEKITISNAVCFKYTELLEALSESDDLEYGYEMAYNYQNNYLCDYFIKKGVSKQAQSLARLKVSALKGDIKELHKALNEGADVKLLTQDTIIEIINTNQAASLKSLYEAGVLLDSSLNQYLNHAMSYHEAYESISYLIELGFDITKIKNLSYEYKRRFPIMADMWEKRFCDIFEYTIYLAKELLPKIEDKEKGEILKKVAELSTLPYVIKKSKEKTDG